MTRHNTHTGTSVLTHSHRARRGTQCNKRAVRTCTHGQPRPKKLRRGRTGRQEVCAPRSSVVRPLRACLTTPGVLSCFQVVVKMLLAGMNVWLKPLWFLVSTDAGMSGRTTAGASGLSCISFSVPVDCRSSSLLSASLPASFPCIFPVSFTYVLPLCWVHHALFGFVFCSRARSWYTDAA